MCFECSVFRLRKIGVFVCDILVIFPAADIHIDEYDGRSTMQRVRQGLEDDNEW
jgi:hypothetical protein